MSATTTDAVKKMSDADQLRKSVIDCTGSIGVAVQGLKEAKAASSWGNDIIAEMRATISFIVALEAAELVLATAAKSVRAALVVSMEDTGSPAIQTEFHTASTKRAPRSVVITGTVPDAMMAPIEPPKPKPDLSAIKAALKGGPLPYAHLSNGGAAVLAITTRKSK